MICSTHSVRVKKNWGQRRGTYNKLHDLVDAVGIRRAAIVARVSRRVQPVDRIEDDRPRAPVECRVKQQFQVPVHGAVILHAALESLARRAPCYPHEPQHERRRELGKEMDPPLYVQVERRPDEPRLDVVSDVHFVVVIAFLTAVNIVNHENRHEHHACEHEIPEKGGREDQDELGHRHMAHAQFAHRRGLVARRLGHVLLCRPVEIVLHIAICLRLWRGRPGAGARAHHWFLVECDLRRLHHSDARRSARCRRHGVAGLLLWKLCSLWHRRCAHRQLGLRCPAGRRRGRTRHGRRKAPPKPLSQRLEIRAVHTTTNRTTMRRVRTWPCGAAATR